MTFSISVMRPIRSKKNRKVNHLSGAHGAAFSGLWTVSKSGGAGGDDKTYWKGEQE
jgi:hypothetical protein